MITCIRWCDLFFLTHSSYCRLDLTVWCQRRSRPWGLSWSIWQWRIMGRCLGRATNCLATLCKRFFKKRRKKPAWQHIQMSSSQKVKLFWPSLMSVILLLVFFFLCPPGEGWAEWDGWQAGVVTEGPAGHDEGEGSGGRRPGQTGAGALRGQTGLPDAALPQGSQVWRCQSPWAHEGLVGRDSPCNSTAIISTFSILKMRYDKWFFFSSVCFDSVPKFSNSFSNWGWDLICAPCLHESCLSLRQGGMCSLIGGF